MASAVPRRRQPLPCGGRHVPALLTSEGTPNVIGEAMACGVPVLASRVSDIPLLVEDGRTGLLFDPGSARDIADAMVRFADLPAEARARMGLEGRRRAEAMLSPETMIGSFIRLMTRLIRDRRGAREPEARSRRLVSHEACSAYKCCDSRPLWPDDAGLPDGLRPTAHTT